MRTNLRARGRHGMPVVVEAMEARRLLSAVVPNVLGLYAGNFTAIGGGSDTLRITITTQHQRSIGGSFAEGSGPVAKFQGNFNAKGVLHFTYQGSGFSGHGTGTFNSTDTIIDGAFMTRQHGQVLGGTFDVQLQGTRPAVPTIPQLGGSQFTGTVQYSNGSGDTIDLTFTSQRNKNLSGFYAQGNGARAIFTATVDVNGALRFRFQGGLPRFHGSGSGTVSNGNKQIDATFTTQQAGKTLAGSFSLHRVTG